MGEELCAPLCGQNWKITLLLSGAGRVLVVTFYLIVWLLLLFRRQHGWQEQRMLGEHHVDHGKLDKFSAPRVLRTIQELCGTEQSLQKAEVMVPKSGRQVKGKECHEGKFIF